MDAAVVARPGYLFILPWDLDHDGGVNQVVINLHREMLFANEFEPIILVNKWSAIRPKENIVDGRRTIYLRLWSPWMEHKSVSTLLKCVLVSPLWMFDLLCLCRRHRVAAINFHFPGLTVFPIALFRFLRLYRGGLIISFHGADLRIASKAGRVERAWWKFLLQSATSIVACSNGFADEVKQFAAMAAGKVHTIHNGLDVPHFLSDVDRTDGLPVTLLGRDFILAIATWEKRKGLDVLVQAFAEVKRTFPDIMLVLLGRASDAESTLRMLATDLDIEKDVLFLESVPHNKVGTFLERARVSCLPSRDESFGIAILEAGAYRRPVVASRVGGIPEIIIDGENGLLVEPDEVGDLATKLVRILDDDDLARTLGECLYQHVIEKFSWKRAYLEYRRLVVSS